MKLRVVLSHLYWKLREIIHRLRFPLISASGKRRTIERVPNLIRAQISELADLEPELKRLLSTKIPVHLIPARSLAGELYFKIAEFLPFSGVDSIVFLPEVKDPEKATLSQGESLSSHDRDRSLFLAMSAASAKNNRNAFPGLKVIDLGTIVDSLTEKEIDQVVLRIILQLSPKHIYTYGNDIGVRVTSRFEAALCNFATVRDS